MDAVIERKDYKRLDFSKIKFDSEPMTTEESLEDINPIHWSDDILCGKRKAVVKRQK